MCCFEFKTRVVATKSLSTLVTLEILNIGTEIICPTLSLKNFINRT